jgi:hypothetical protein
MKKIILGLGMSMALFSCANKDLDILKNDLKTSDKLSDQEIESTEFKTIKMLASDGKKALIGLSLDRKFIVATKGGLYASSLDVCKDSEIKENTDVYYTEAYRIAKDTVFKKIYFTNENKIVGKFKLK